MTSSSSLPVSSSRLEHPICFWIGVLDGCLFVTYLLKFDQAYFYVASIAIKLILIEVTRQRNSNAAVWSAVPFTVLLLTSETISGLLNELEWLAYIKVIVFSLNILATLNFVSEKYWRGLFLANVANGAIYLVMFQTGRIENVFGRYSYYNLVHPNLGSELLFGAAFAGLLGRRPKLLVLGLPFIFLPVFLMQGRAAELGIAAIASICGAYIFRRLGLEAQAAILVLLAVAVSVFLLYVDLGTLVSKLLLLDDKYRGEGTDASGRSAYWGTAIQVWLDYPFFGAGSSYPSRLGVLQAHNFFLYGLADYGLLGAVLLSVFLFQLGSVALAGYWQLVLPLIPMLIFNDRFINLNTYPTVMFLFVFAYFARSRPSKRKLTSEVKVASGLEAKNSVGT